MNFEYTDEQRLLKDSVDRLVNERYGDFERRKAIQQKPGGWSRSIWQDFTEMGLTAVPFDEDSGGLGGGPIETLIIMEAVGRSLVLEPVLPAIVLGGSALRLAANAAQKESVIPGVIEGNSIVVLAHNEREARYDLHDVATTARQTDGGFSIDGRKSVVLNGDSADYLIVSARTSGAKRDRAGITLFLIDAKASGVEVRGYAAQDDRRVAEIVLSGVRVGKDAVLGQLHQGLPILEEVTDIGIAALAAEAVGAMEALHLMTVDYLKTRTQFDVPLSSFQALQHRSVDMLIALEQARSMAVYAAMMLEAPATERRSALSAVKVQINRSARFVAQQAIQLHGAIGVTLEYKASHYFKRLTAIEALFGDTDHHLDAVASYAAA